MFPILVVDPGVHAGVAYGVVENRDLFVATTTVDLEREDHVDRAEELATNLRRLLRGLPNPRRAVVLDTTRYSRGRMAARSQLLQVGVLYATWRWDWPMANCHIEVSEMEHRLAVTGGRTKADVTAWGRQQRWWCQRWLTNHEIDALVNLLYWARGEHDTVTIENLWGLGKKGRKK